MAGDIDADRRSVRDLGTDLVIAGGQGQEEAVWAMDWAFRHGEDLEHPKPRRTQIGFPEVRRSTAGAQSPHGPGHGPMGGSNTCESDQLDLIRRISPHIRHFIRVRAALAGARALNASFEELLDHDLAGVLCVERRAGSCMPTRLPGPSCSVATVCCGIETATCMLGFRKRMGVSTGYWREHGPHPWLRPSAP